MNSMRVVAISDTHNRHEYLNLPDGDILIHAGDATGMGTVPEVERFARWFCNQKHPLKLFIPGNHDWMFANEYANAVALFNGATVLHDQSIVLNGLKFYGSAWQPEFCNWAFNVPRGAASAANWAKIPEDTDVLITHGPPHGILDIVRDYHQDVHVGCEALMARIPQLTNLSLHIFGHIHDSHGQVEKDGVNYINAAYLDDNYRPAYAPIVIDIVIP